MARERLCRYCGNWHPVDNWPHNCLPPAKPRSELPAPSVIADTIEPVQSMLDGRMYDSKAALRQTYKDHGAIEVGNDSSVTNPKPHKPKRPDRKEIGAAVDRAFSQAGLGV